MTRTVFTAPTLISSHVVREPVLAGRAEPQHSMPVGGWRGAAATATQTEWPRAERVWRQPRQERKSVPRQCQDHARRASQTGLRVDASNREQETGVGHRLFEFVCARVTARPSCSSHLENAQQRLTEPSIHLVPWIAVIRLASADVRKGYLTVTCQLEQSSKDGPSVCVCVPTQPKNQGSRLKSGPNTRLECACVWLCYFGG